MVQPALRPNLSIERDCSMAGAVGRPSRQTLEVTRSRNTLVAAALVPLFGVSDAEASNIDQALSSDFLSRLMLARASRSEIAAIHEQAGSAMLINAEDPGKAVVY